MEGLQPIPESFTIRVYGIMLDDERGKRFSKFPGGGLELGEGIRDCLLREWREELGQTIEVTEHFYTTDVFQISAFNPKQQVISIYFLVKALDEASIKISDVPFDFEEGKENA